MSCYSNTIQIVSVSYDLFILLQINLCSKALNVRSKALNVRSKALNVRSKALNVRSKALNGTFASQRKLFYCLKRRFLLWFDCGLTILVDHSKHYF